MDHIFGVADANAIDLQSHRIIEAVSTPPPIIEIYPSRMARLKNISVLVELRPRVIGSIREGCNVAIHPYVRDTPPP